MELPAFFEAEVNDVGGVVAGVPCVEHGGEFDALGSVFGVAEASLPLAFVEGLEEHDPSGVEAFDQFERPLHGGGGVVKGGPGILVVGLDGGPIFGERKADADEGVHVAVGEVMDDLTECPAALAIGSVELRVGQTLDCVAKFSWQIGEGCNGFESLIGRDGRRLCELTNGVAWVSTRSWHGVPLDSEEQS